MARWTDVVENEAEFADEVRKAFDAYTHKTLATLRKDGSPRISGSEAGFVDGDLWFGSMPGALKALDLLRDPRFALHAGTGDADSDSWRGDAKLSGRAVEVTDPEAVAAVYRAWTGEAPEGPSHLFRAELTDVVLTTLNQARDGLAIRLWTPDGGLRTFARK
ncbi:pyridoxamine 5'-phosphate oxidase family protein [Streptodolium elevatio]